MRALGNGIQNYYGSLNISAAPGTTPLTVTSAVSAAIVASTAFTGSAVNSFSNTSAGTANTVETRQINDAGSYISYFTTSSGYTGTALSGGPSGISAGIYTSGAYPLLFGVAGVTRGYFDTSGNLNISNGVGLSPVYAGIPQRAYTTSQSTVLTDAGKHLANFTGALTITIAANTSVPYPIGTTLTFVSGVGDVTTIAITSDTLYWAATGGTGTRTLAALGIATALKVGANAWIISGTGLS